MAISRFVEMLLKDVTMTKRQIIKKMNCTHCHGLGYTEEKTGVVSPHMPYIEETYKEPCDHCDGTGEMAKKMSREDYQTFSEVYRHETLQSDDIC
jgi:hypothetical protein